ncbi:MAG TPA: accessory Sec system S-layer assembly protein [Bacillota bacterium]|nr:accessory Sec system S-layer assembly protein [Bacillota bacterium]
MSNKDNNVTSIDDYKDGIETELSIPNSWDITNEDRYVYAFHNSQSPKLEENQLSIYGIEIFEKDGGLEVTGLIRSTITQPVELKPMTIILFGPDEEIIGRKPFDFSKLGALPTNSARPWKFHYTTKDLLKQVDLPMDDWSLAFQIEDKHRLELEESWEKSIGESTRDSLEKIVDEAKPLKPGEVNFLGISANQKENKDLSITVLIRNGTENNISFKEIPLAVRDATGEEVVRGHFKLDDFSVSANTSKPWTFIFPASTLLTDTFDFSKWSVYVIQK